MAAGPDLIALKTSLESALTGVRTLRTDVERFDDGLAPVEGAIAMLQVSGLLFGVIETALERLELRLKSLDKNPKLTPFVTPARKAVETLENAAEALADALDAPDLSACSMAPGTRSAPRGIATPRMSSNGWTRWR